jgi:predicted PurR-regulated permease PerM
MVLNIPLALIHLAVVMFVFFFALRDGREAVEYLRSLSPLKVEMNQRIFEKFKDITNSVLIGQILIGIIQGLIAGIGYFILGVPNALLLTLLTIIAGIIPIIGPPIVWIPVDIYLFLSGRPIAAIFLLIYGTLIVGWIDNLLRPLFVSIKTKLNTGIVTIGMIGGLLSFGIAGLILGPLILAYVLIVFEIYQKKNIQDSVVFIKEET